MKLGLAAIAVLAMVPRDAGAKCARVEQVPLVLTTEGAKISADGGVLVGWQDTTDDVGPTRGDPSSPAGWSGELDGKAAALARTQLAPGLGVYKPAQPARGALVLRDAKGAAQAHVTLGANHVALAAPKVSRVEAVTRKGFRGIDTDVIAYVDGVPDDAVALIVSTTGGDAHALSFGRPAHDRQGATSVVVYAHPGHCGSLPNGTVAAARGDKVTLAWVDASGILSPASAAIAVQAGTP